MKKKLLGIAVAIAAALGIGFAAIPAPAGATTDGHQIVYEDQSYTANTVSYESVACPAGKVATGGGYGPAPYENEDYFEVVQSSPSNADDSIWIVSAKNKTANAESMRIYVVCLDD